MAVAVVKSALFSARNPRRCAVPVCSLALSAPLPAPRVWPPTPPLTPPLSSAPTAHRPATPPPPQPSDPTRAANQEQQQRWHRRCGPFARTRQAAGAASSAFAASRRKRNRPRAWPRTRSAQRSAYGGRSVKLARVRTRATRLMPRVWRARSAGVRGTATAVGHPQHWHLGAHRLWQDDAHGTHPVLHGPHP